MDTSIDKSTGYAMVANALKLFGKSKTLVGESAESGASNIKVALAASGETLGSAAAIPAPVAVAAASQQKIKSKVVVHPPESHGRGFARMVNEGKAEAAAALVREKEEAKVAKAEAKVERERAAAERKLLKKEKTKNPKSKTQKSSKAARLGEFAFFPSSHFFKLTVGAIKKEVVDSGTDTDQDVESEEVPVVTVTRSRAKASPPIVKQSKY